VWTFKTIPDPAVVVDVNLIGWWKFDGDYLDSSGYENHGTGYGSDVGIVSHPERGQVLSLNGTDDYVGMGQSLLNDVAELTLAGWVRAGNAGSGSIGLFGQNDAVEFGFNGADIHCWTSGGGEARTAWTAEPLTWHHVAAVGDGTTLVLYVDGEPVITGGSTTTSYGSSTYPFNIGGGGIWGAGGNWLSGQIDDVRLYDKALSGAEIAVLAVANIATIPVPDDGATLPPQTSGENLFLLLQFTAGKDAVTHTAYFSDNYEDVNGRDAGVSLGRPPYPGEFPTGYYVGLDDPNVAAFARASLVVGETYYWAVDENDGVTTWPGKVWSFTIMSEKAWNPGPADGAPFVAADPNATLSWSLGDIDTTDYYVSYEVYYGTVFADVNTGTTPNATVTGTSHVAGPLAPVTKYYWRIDTILKGGPPDFETTTIKGDIWTFTSAPRGVGKILREWWLGITGDSISNLTSDPDYPDNPDDSELLDIFEGPTDWDADYGSRIHGWLYVMESGDYTFWIASDNHSQLWLSTDERPDNTTQIAGVETGDGWTSSREWTKFASQRSTPVYLEAGERYYICALQKEGGGGDNLAVAWQGPDQPDPPVNGQPDAIIPGSNLKPFVPLWARSPDPADGQTNVPLSATLSWDVGIDESTGGVYAAQHVYFGTDANAVANADTTSPEYLDPPTGPNEYGPLSLDYYERYYWRIDGVSGSGEVYKGSLWSFKVTYDPALIVDPTLVGWWRLDDGSGTFVTDSSGYGNHGAVNGNPKWTAGYDGDALRFDGVDDFVEVPHDELLTMDNEVTVMAWINAQRHTGPGGEGWQGILAKGQSTRSYSLYTVGSSGVLHLSTAGVGTTSTATVPLNEWVHVVAMVVNGGHRYYINGELAGEDGSGIVLPGTADTDTVVIGRTNEAAGTREFLGMIDDARIYNRSLSQAEIAAIMRINPAWAWSPKPGNGATGVDREPTLSWTPGDYSLGGGNVHYVSFGADDPANMIAIGPQPQAPNYIAVGTLDLGRTYYWAVDEANGTVPGSVDAGRIWSFTTTDHLVVDDMEEDYVIWGNPGLYACQVWVDGSGDCSAIPGNGTGSLLGLETTISYPDGFEHSMKVEYDNDGIAYNYCTEEDETRLTYSMAKAEVANLPSGIGSDWTTGGAKALSLQFQGSTGNTIEDMWVELTDSAIPTGKATVTYGDYADENKADIGEPNWHEWNIDFQDFADGGVDLTKVKTIAIGIGTVGGGAGGGGTVYFDEILLYAPRCIFSRREADFALVDFAPEGIPGGDCVIDYKELDVMSRDWLLGDADIEPQEPDPDGLVAWYDFENNANDSSPNGNDGTENGEPSYSIGHVGSSALDLDGIDDYIDCGNGASLNVTDEVTITMWIKTDDAGNGEDNPYVAKGDVSYAFKHKNTDNLEFFVYDGDWHVVSFPVDSSFNGLWHHLAGTYDGAQLKMYVDGELKATTDYVGVIAVSADNLNIGRNSGVTDRFFDGAIDDVRIYDYALTIDEILHTGGFAAVYVPLVSPANVYDSEPATQKVVNFKDYAVLMAKWLDEDIFP
ncbi:MAG: hypothetical protein KAY65_04325, partial [Planctomycetes bacterium]|nr:hypothetical protein [Planctomycetota bacterium]